MAGISASTPAPELNQILSKDARKAAGIGDYYIDTYNDSQLAKYNNEYNYWLWQQQTDYNSPANQVARLKEAGLNPNFNSIDGTGNASSMPTSNANYRSDIYSKELAQAQTGIQAFNTLLTAIGQGVSAYSKIQNTPQNTRAYLDLMQDLNIDSKIISNTKESYNVLKDLRDNFGIDIDKEYTLNSIAGLGGVGYSATELAAGHFINSDNSVNYSQKQLRNEAMELSNQMREFEAGNLQPLEEQKLREQIHQLGLKMNLDQKQLQYFDYMMGIKGGALLMSFLGKIL